MKITEFTYQPHPELIAQYPLKNREQARLLVLERQTGRISHHKFYEIVDFFNAGDVLVLNNTKVFKARLKGKKESGGSVEVLLVRESKEGLWESIVSHSRRLKVNNKIIFDQNTYAAVRRKEKARCFLEFNTSVLKIIERCGIVPLPHYIKRNTVLSDEEYYQTVFAKEDGSIAAPTAGLHFTSEILKEIEKKGTKVVEITLHIGPGTFKPIRAENIENHRMELEYIDIDYEATQKINQGKRIIGVGTSVSRALESVTNCSGAIYRTKHVVAGFTLQNRRINTFSGFTDLFIYPGYKFKIIDCLITNFHLPCSTPLVLVCAFAGKDLLFRAYKEAIEQRYRFLSYGDAMLII